MLVLGRKPGEFVKLTVPPSTEETVIHVLYAEHRTETGRIGFEAPQRVRIVRDDARHQS